MDQRNSQPALSVADNSTNQPMLQLITQSTPSVPGTTNPSLGLEFVNSTTHAARSPNPPSLELVTTQAASSVHRTSDDLFLVSNTSQDVFLPRNY